MKINISKKERSSRKSVLIKLQNEIYKYKHIRYYIKYSWKHGYPKGDPEDWRSWRSFAVIGKLFYNKEDAEEYMKNHVFKNMKHLRKLSASIESTIISK